MDKNGINHTSDGYEVDISDDPFIQKPLNGKNAISGITFSLVNGEECIVYGVAYYDKKGAIIGALVSPQTKDHLR